MLKVVGVFGAVLTMFAYAVLAERKISAWIQGRVGPNRTAPPLALKIPFLGALLQSWGIFQPMADGLKAFLKEDFTPNYVRKAYFWLAPAISMVPAFLVLAVVPFGSKLGNEPMVIANLDVGILYTFGIISLGVYGVVLAGYASNSKYPFLGGIRSSAQMISYEIAMGMSVVPLFLIVGELNLSDVISWQAKNGWLILYSPISFVIFLIAAFAETNRLPFDMPESESELVSGYHTEYSSMKFALFFLGEYTAMIVGSSLVVVFFLGGWHMPGIPDGNGNGGLEILQHLPHWILGFINITCFFGKVAALLVCFIWVRWTLPRFRFDQVMKLGWLYLFEIALANIILTAAIIAFTSK